MDKINWKQKLTSRKFWAAILAVAAAMMALLKTDAVTQEEVLALGWAVAALIAYILGEGLVDAVRQKNSGSTDTSETTETTDTEDTKEETK
jgi:adenine/guanine phosphoribosyltransferase-like PRPP-binding protein